MAVTAGARTRRNGSGAERMSGNGGPAEGAPAEGAPAEAAPAEAAPAPTAARQRAGQKELARLERQIARLTDSETRLAAELTDNVSDYARLIELGAELRGIQAEREGLEERWLAVAEEIS
jgi:ATP-binding cassette subfamily F protein uup